MRDKNLVASQLTKPVNYKNSDSLNGLVLGGTLGHQYVELEKQLRTGKIRRVDAVEEKQNILKLKSGRVDVIFLHASAISFYRKRYPDLDQWIYIAAQPRSVFKRYFMASHQDTAIIDYLNTLIPVLINDPVWKNMIPDDLLLPSHELDK